MDCVCLKCCFDEVEFPETDCTEVSWEQWERVTSTNGGNISANVLKQTYTGTIQDLKVLFHKKLETLVQLDPPNITVSQTWNKISLNLMQFFTLIFQNTMPTRWVQKYKLIILALAGSRPQYTLLSFTQSMVLNMQHYQTGSAMMSGSMGTPGACTKTALGNLPTHYCPTCNQWWPCDTVQEQSKPLPP